MAEVLEFGTLLVKKKVTMFKNIFEFLVLCIHYKVLTPKRNVTVFFLIMKKYVDMVDMGVSSTLWSLPLPNITWHSGTWPYTMTPSIDQTLHQFANLLPNWTLLPVLTLLQNFGGFLRTLQRVRLVNRGRLLLWTPGSIPFGTCIWSNVETILSWTCHVYGPFEFRTSLGTSNLIDTLVVFLPFFYFRNAHEA